MPRASDFDRDRLLDLLADLVAARTENPPGDEHLAAHVMTRFLDHSGIAHRTVEYAPGRSNVIAEIGSGKKGIALVCHFDVVPAGDGWSTDPFKLTVKRGHAYGRGVLDNKGQLAACLMLMDELHRNKVDLGGRLVVVGCADEERGSTLGMVKLVEQGEIEADAAVIPDCAGEMKKLYIAEKGLCLVEVTAHGKQAHGSTPWEGVSAVSGMAEFVTALEKAKLRKGRGLLKKTTVNVGQINGGVAPNVVPAQCVAEVDIRFLPGDSPASLVKRLKEIASRVAGRHKGLKFTFDVKTSMMPFELKRTDPLVKLVRRHAEAHLDEPPELCGLGGTTVAKQFIEKGIAAVGFAPGADGAHMANEKISIKQLQQFCAIMHDVVTDYLRA